MRRFNDFDLTDKEWEEIFDFPKEFKKGDIVENKSAGGSDKGMVWEVVRKCGYHGKDIVYELKNLNTGHLGKATSTFMNYIGTFIDDETYETFKENYC